MVGGIEVFREYFQDYAGQYVFIGGTACDIILGNMNVDFRATKDLDMVLILEALDEDFINTFISFIESGGYQHMNKGTGKNQFYRFSSPTELSYPAMIELFSRRPDYLETIDTRLAPIHVSDDAVSLSAILLDDAYYNLLKRGAVEVEGISVLGIEYLILFKIKAWLDLSERKENGEQIDSRNIKKHKNDVIRLAANLAPDAQLEISGAVKSDVEDFFGRGLSGRVDVNSLGIRGVSFEDIIARARECFGL